MTGQLISSLPSDRVVEYNSCAFDLMGMYRCVMVKDIDPFTNTRFPIAFIKDVRRRAEEYMTRLEEKLTVAYDAQDWQSIQQMVRTHQCSTLETWQLLLQGRCLMETIQQWYTEKNMPYLDEHSLLQIVFSSEQLMDATLLECLTGPQWSGPPITNEMVDKQVVASGRVDLFVQYSEKRKYEVPLGLVLDAMNAMLSIDTTDELRQTLYMYVDRHRSEPLQLVQSMFAFCNGKSEQALILCEGMDVWYRVMDEQPAQVLDDVLEWVEKQVDQFIVPFYPPDNYPNDNAWNRDVAIVLCDPFRRQVLREQYQRFEEPYVVGLLVSGLVNRS